jgi:Skp family chaperone for outer membrane proteins
MIDLKNAAALVLGLAVAVAASPAMAAQKHRAENPGYTARAQAVPSEESSSKV